MGALRQPHRVDVAADARVNLNRLHGFELAGEVRPFGHGLENHWRDFDARRRGRGDLLGRGAATGHKKRSGERHQALGEKT